MKGALITAAALLAGSAQAGVHKLKLKKVPLAEQLVGQQFAGGAAMSHTLLTLWLQETIPIDAQMRHLSQKYMGVRPESHTQAVFKEPSFDTTGNHLVPVSNFMNAQCT